MIYLQLMTDEEIETVFHGLAQLPWARSNDIIHRLNEAVSEKRRADAKAKAQRDFQAECDRKEDIPVKDGSDD